MENGNGAVGINRREAVQACGAATLAALAASASPTWARSAAAPVVSTRAGQLRGFARDGIQHFLGIPYGAPTGGAGRFKAPQPAVPWAGVRPATEFGPTCPQTIPGASPQRTGALATIGDPPPAGESEDCLNINVWTPSADGEKRAVMVWIHGGAFAVGSGSMAVYNGANLARRGDVVVVGITHRLNIFGYAYLGGLLGPDYAQSGSVGMLDLILALQWVRDTIAAFGGDPARVTIFGESGGGGKVSTLLSMPKARGLFQRAVIQSGSNIFLPEVPEADGIVRQVIASMGLQSADARALLTMSTTDLVKGGMGFTHKSPLALLAYEPVVDGDLIPAQSCYPVAPAVSREIPVLMGTNLTESALMWMGDPTAFGMDEARLRARLANTLGKADIDRIIPLYRTHYPWASPSDIFLLVMSERSMRRNLWRMADARAAANDAPTFAYHFRFPTPYMNGQLHTPHFMEVPLIFQNHHLAGVSTFTGTGPAVDAMANSLSDLWTSFAKTGQPAAAGIPAWVPYSLARRETMVLDASSSLVDDPDDVLRRFWQSADYQII
jgi:para-nitrobenzyl esterase